MEVMVPKENNNDQIVMITKLYVDQGCYVELGADLVEFETSKTAVVLQSPVSGYVSFYHKVEDEVEVNSPVCRIDEQAPKASVSGDAAAVKALPDRLSQEGVTFSKMASKVDKHNAKLDGKYWVTSRMLNANSSRLHAGSGRSVIDSHEQVRNPPQYESGDHSIRDEEYKVTKTTMRKRSEIASMRISGGGEFQSTIGCEIIVGLRLAKNIVFDNSIQDLACYESSKMLGSEYNDLNAFYISDSKVGRFNSVAVGISLDNVNNLTVAQIKNSDKLGLREIQDQLALLFIQFEDSTLPSESLLPSTYTITDLSATGATYMLPLLNGAESLILGIVRKNSNSFGVYATFDHRVSDGLRVATFLDDLKIRIEAHFTSGSTVELVQCNFCLKSLSEELELGNRGLLCISTVAGQKNICSNCYQGW
jgi:pyruvate/2-oxoglutarate dehydrogenase complex dihydrolipoamide acyltransferase (E2) component